MALPTVIYVMRGEDGDADYLIAGESMNELNLDTEETAIVGIYQLGEVLKAKYVLTTQETENE